jgi:hypothetical protein
MKYMSGKRRKGKSWWRKNWIKITVGTFVIALIGISSVLAYLRMRGNLHNLDWDGDGFSNWFEQNVSGTDPLVPNERYAIFLSTSDERVPDVGYVISVMGMGIPESNVIRLVGENAKYSKLRDVLLKVAEKTNDKDLVLVSLAAHGIDGSIILRDGGTTYAQMDEDLDKIKAKVLIVTIDSCFSGSAIPYLKDGPCPRIVITQTDRYQAGLGSELFDHFFPALAGHVPYMPYFTSKDPTFFKRSAIDQDRNGQVSVEEAQKWAFDAISDNTIGLHPQASDTSGIGGMTYFCEITPSSLAFGEEHFWDLFRTPDTDIFFTLSGGARTVKLTISDMTGEFKDTLTVPDEHVKYHIPSSAQIGTYFVTASVPGYGEDWMIFYVGHEPSINIVEPAENSTYERGEEMTVLAEVKDERGEISLSNGDVAFSIFDNNMTRLLSSEMNEENVGIYRQTIKLNLSPGSYFVRVYASKGFYWQTGHSDREIRIE